MNDASNLNAVEIQGIFKTRIQQEMNVFLLCDCYTKILLGNLIMRVGRTGFIKCSCP